MPEAKAAAARANNLRKYRLTPERVREMEIAQGGRCAICANAPPAGTRLVVDHDHETNIVRALLCTHCNLILGHARDDAGRLILAAVYLEKHRRP